VSELAAYVRAGLPPVSGATPVAVPTDQGLAVEGSALQVRDGCIDCHGPTASTACPTRSRRTGRSRRSPAPIFRGEFNTPAKIANVIRSGSVIGRVPIVSMPRWGGILTTAHVNALIAYPATGDQGLKPFSSSRSDGPRAG